MKNGKEAKKAPLKERAAITVRLFPSTHKRLKIQAAEAQLSVARFIDRLVKTA